MTQVAEVMTRGVLVLSPSDTLVAAAQAMDDLNVGSIPVCENNRVIGMVTDRDITVRGIAQGCNPETTQLSEVMTEQVETCYEDDALEDATQKMQDVQIRRLPVLDHNEELVGIVSLGDVATKGDQDQAAIALCDISDPCEPDRSAISGETFGANGSDIGSDVEEPDSDSTGREVS
jgi:CBS domain-containing protein